MACLEHTCRNCAWFTVSNSSAPLKCPVCKGKDFVTSIDEDPEPPDDWEPWEYEEDEEQDT